MGKGRERVGVDEDAGKNAVTDFQVLERAGIASTGLLYGRVRDERISCARIASRSVVQSWATVNTVGATPLSKGCRRTQRSFSCMLEIAIPQDGGRDLRIVAPLPAHMRDVWKMLGFEDEPPIEPFDGID